MKLVLAYELPLILSVITVIIKAAGAIKLEQIIFYQISYGSFIFSFLGSSHLLFPSSVSRQRLGLAPFDISEAEQELMAGVLIEYSGPAFGNL